MDIVRIGMVGSRKLPTRHFEHYQVLAARLAAAGYEIVSGGCPTGADEAALQGALSVPNSKITLFLDHQLHRNRVFPDRVKTVYVDLDKADEIADLGYRHTTNDAQRGKYWGYFLRNAHIAAYSDIVIGWRHGDANGTNHTLSCAKELGKPLILMDVAALQQRWQTRAAMVQWVFGELRRMEDAA